MRHLPAVVLGAGLLLTGVSTVFPEDSGWLFFGGITVAVIGLVAVLLLRAHRDVEAPEPGMGDVALAVLAVAGMVFTVTGADEPVIFFPPPFLLTWFGGGWLLCRLSLMSRG